MSDKKWSKTMSADFFKLMKLNKKRLPAYFAGMLFMTLATAVMEIVGAFVTKNLVDAAGTGDFVQLRSAVVFGIAGLLGSAAAYPFAMYTYNYQAKHITADLRNTVVRHRSELPVSYFEGESAHSGDLISRIFHDINSASQLFGSRLRRFLAPIIWGAANIISMLILDWRITLIFCAVNALCLFVNTRFAAPISALSREISKATAAVMEKFVNLISGALIIRSYSLKETVTDEFSGTNAALTKKTVGMGKLSAWLESANFLFDLFTGLAFIAIATVFVERGYTTFGTLVGLVSLQRSLSRNFLAAGQNAAQVGGSMAGVRRIIEFLETPKEPDFFEGMPKIAASSYIEMRDVSFSYNPEREILHSFSMKVEKGEKVALAGPSGAGKSTIAKLIMGFYRPESGVVAVNGETFSQRSIKNTRGMIAYVPQEPYLYDETIMENIRLGRPDADDDAVIAAAKAANAHDFILLQKDGYNTRAGERGTMLSGGQRQRIAIARAFLKNAPILILDEATSALDNESEILVQDAITRLMADRTAVIIAHRPSTIASADRVVSVGK